MSPAEYISSGILETYALGAATPAEKQEVEAMLGKSAEVRAAFEQILSDIEAYATLHAVQPDEKLRDKILGTISAAIPANGVSEKPKIIPLKTAPAPSRLKFLAVAASLILVVSVCMNIFQWKKMGSLSAEQEKLTTQVAAAQAERQLLITEVTASQTALDRTVDDLNFLRNPMTRNVALNSVIKDHPMNARVYVDMNSMQLAVDPMTLPATSAGEQYVLWAMVKGLPVNVGDFDLESEAGLMMMKVSPDAEAYAISLEKSGDVTAPAGPIYVMGKMSPSQP
ncbi:MAG: anti-sigma factor [Bacteroidota bacterium]|nr:anti-sigma factor [Bacteroidota bacterium]